MPNPGPFSFPPGFRWGTATAAYQIEGAHEADGKGLSIWDTFTSVPGRIENDDHGRLACDHYHCYEQDFDLLKELGVDSYRLSLAWTRLLPEGRGKVNEAGLAFYDRLIDALLARGITPFVTLFHWDFPAALNDQGGWLNRDSADWFADYCTVAVRRLGDRVGHWMTLNEPQCSVGFGYADGVFAPGYKLAWAEVLKAAHHQLLAHGKGVQAIRAASPAPCQVGIAPVGQNCYLPRTETPENIEAARTATFAVNRRDQWNLAWWLDPVFLGRYPEDGLRFYGAEVPSFPSSDLSTIQQPLDFMALNVYKGEWVVAGPGGEPLPAPREVGAPEAVLPWLRVTPPALYWSPRFCMERYGKMPFYITENGFCGTDWVQRDGRVQDPARIDYLARYLGEYRRLVAEGFPLQGYFLWSFLDNFEWTYGYRGRFGLVHVDYATQKRTPKSSFFWYQNVIRSNGAEL